jgi:hypothetical protein
MIFFSISDTLLDVHGRLEGESIVKATFQDKFNLWWYQERERLSFSQPAVSLDPSSLSPNVIEAQITSVATTRRLQGDWKEPIRLMLRSPGVNIRITDKPHSGSASASP